MIEPEEIVNFMKENVMNDVNMQIQLHKIIWSPDKKESDMENIRK